MLWSRLLSVCNFEKRLRIRTWKHVSDHDDKHNNHQFETTTTATTLVVLITKNISSPANKQEIQQLYATHERYNPISEKIYPHKPKRRRATDINIDIS